MKQRKHRFTVLFLVLGSVGILVGSTVRKEFKKSYDFSRGGEVLVKNTNGIISVEP